MRIKINHPVSVRLDLRPGDEVVIADPPEHLKTFLKTPQGNGSMLASVVDDEEIADVDRSDAELAVVGRQRRHVSRPETVAR